MKHNKSEKSKVQKPSPNEPSVESLSFPAVFTSLYQLNLDAAGQWLNFIGMNAPNSNSPHRAKKSKLG